MQVETFEAISLDEQDGKIVNELVSEEALALVEALGLEGQRRFTVEEEVGGEQVERRNPYREFTAEEMAVYRTVFPRVTALAAYGFSPIPLRVLQVAAHAAPMFEKLEVWHPENVAEDPLLVGVKGHPAREWEKRHYILARWGDVLVPFEELRDKARRILTTTMRAKLADARAQVEVMAASMEANIEQYITTGKRDRIVFLNLAIGTE